ncbi:MAG TPA: hypothetical protein PLP17_17625, partial [Oligoflexia bacterium]|nr:hypothetical protein [Oligoflexia bacterium]
NRQISGLVRQLFLRSESRGKDASGVAVLEGNVAHVLKRRVRGKKLIQLAEYQRLFNEHPRYTAVLGHCRMETNGSSRLHENNQPVCKHNMLCLHNGIVSNQDYIRRTCAALQLDYGVDTEIFLELIRLERQSGVALGKALHKALAETDGAYSLALVDPASALIILTTNNGSLYLWEPDNLGLLVFASEFRILARALMASSFGSKEIISGISQAAPRAMIERRLLFSNPESVNEEVRPAETEPAVIDYGPVVEVPAPACSKTSLSEKLCLDGDYLRASVMAGKLQRCSRCILPETFPNIRYDDNGVCNYCRAYRAMCPKGVDNLREEIRRLAGEGGVSCI